MKKRKKVSWKRLDCQDEIHKSTTFNKVTTWTPGVEEPELDEDKTSVDDYNSPGDLCQKKDKHEEEHRHAREGPRKSCWRLRQEFFRRYACMEESVNRKSPEHVPDHEFHESLKSRRSENFQSATGESIPNLGDLRLPLYMREGTIRGMVMKASPITNSSGSVKKICRASHTVVFDDEGSFIVIEHWRKHWRGYLAERRGWKLHVGRVDTTSTAGL